MIGIAQGGNPLQWALHDGMGSTAYMEAANGSITANYQYTPTGQTFLASGGLQGWPFLFTGRDIGLDQNYYNRNRYYDPTLYRFMSPDPLSFGGGDTNLYAYVQNSPTNLIDPLGLSGGPAGGGPAGGSGGQPKPHNSKQRGLMSPDNGDTWIPWVSSWADATTITEVGGGTIHVGPVSTPSPTTGPSRALLAQVTFRDVLIEQIEKLLPGSGPMLPMLNEGQLVDMLERLQAERAAVIAARLRAAAFGSGTLLTAGIMVLLTPETTGCGAGEQCATGFFP